MIALVAVILAASPQAERCAEVQRQAAQARPAELKGLLAALPRPVLADGSRGSLPALDAALQELTDHPDDDAAASARQTLQATCAQLARAAGAPALTHPALLAQILAEPQFAGRAGQPFALDRLFSRALDLLKELLQQRGFRSFSLVGRDLFLAAVLLVLVAAGVQVLRRRRSLEAVRPPAGTAPRPFHEASEEELAAQAEQALHEGDVRGALRLAMRALVAAVGARGLIDQRGAATNRELARALSARTATLGEEALRLAESFDQAVYGEGPVDPAAAARFLADIQGVRRALPERP